MKGFSLFRHALIGAAMYLLPVACSPVFADQWAQAAQDNAGNFEIRVLSMNLEEKASNGEDVPNQNGPYVVLACRGSTFSISLDWRERVGKVGERRRHIFYHVDGDSHLMLPVLDRTGQSTGYVKQSAKAKALVQAILASSKRDFIPIGVFPAGRDALTGQWIDAWFPATAFRKSALMVGKTCNFDPMRAESDAHNRDKVPPARPGSQ